MPSPYGKILRFGNIRPERFKQFVRFKRLWVSLCYIEIAFSSRWKRLCPAIICLPLKEIRIQRDSSTTEHNLRRGFSRSIGTVKESLNQVYLSLCRISIEGQFFPELHMNSFCSGAPQRGAHYCSGFATYC